MNQSIIQTDETRCAGCNKCVAKCPVHANSAVLTDRGIKIHIDPKRCIACGECIHVCDHGARSYTDDTELFLRICKTTGKSLYWPPLPSATTFPSTASFLPGCAGRAST